jgi:hypothetical protein
MSNFRREVMVVRYPSSLIAALRVLGYILLFYTVIIGACALATAIK